MPIEKDDALAFRYVDMNFWQETTLAIRKIQSKVVIALGMKMGDTTDKLSSYFVKYL